MRDPEVSRKPDAREAGGHSRRAFLERAGVGAGTIVAAAHAGWRGLAGGVLENTVAAMGRPASQLLAWLGPAIGAGRFEVGGEVRDAFLTAAAGVGAAARFTRGAGDRWMCDLTGLARDRLLALGVRQVTGGDGCTASEPARFFSHRRDAPRTGRMAALVWIDPGGQGVLEYNA